MYVVICLMDDTAEMNVANVHDISIDETSLDNVVSNIDETNRRYMEAHSIIDDLFQKYSSDPYMTSKIHNYICKQLSTVMENVHNNYIERMERFKSLTCEQDNFIESFLKPNQYFYIPSTEIFFFYDGLNYEMCHEDDILYNVLSSITREGQLMPWKQKTKIFVLKRIKDNNLLKSIPHTHTIQTVLNLLYPAIFSNKNEAKYFLTILGDNIFKKNSHLIHFINPKAKPFIKQLNELCKTFIGQNLYQTFKYKYHEQHDYMTCRLVKINDCIVSENVWMPILNTCFLNLVCVASHYSDRFNNSDDFALKDCDYELESHVFYLKNTNPDVLIDLFVRDYLQIDRQVDVSGNGAHTYQITWKNMQYLWRRYLENKRLPSVMFQQTLKNYLVMKLDTCYNTELDSFIGMRSRFLPSIEQFLHFWDTNIIYDENESDFEIEEVLLLFKHWCESNGSHANMNDKQLLDIICYYYPDIEIEGDKYIHKIRSNLWDKQTDIQVALEICKEEYRKEFYSRYSHSYNHERVSSPLQNHNIQIYHLYTSYCKYMSEKKLIVNKSYFEKYVYDNLSNYLVDATCVSSDWVVR
jgi:hypothetical protein